MTFHNVLCFIALCNDCHITLTVNKINCFFLGGGGLHVLNSVCLREKEGDLKICNKNYFQISFLTREQFYILLYHNLTKFKKK